jgi:hypothetical protein
MMFLAYVETLRLVINRVMISFLKDFWFLLEDSFGRLYFCIVKYLNFHHSSFALRYFLM